MKNYLRVLIIVAAAAALVAGIICGKKGVLDDLFEQYGSGIKDRASNWKRGR